MATCKLYCRIEIRKWMKPLIILSALTRWDWLMKRCINVSVVSKLAKDK